MKEKEYGIVYVLSNPWMPGLVKIGKTTSTRLQQRMQNLYGTGVPEPFRLEYACALGLDEYSEFELALHSLLAQNRVNKNREFFKMSPEELKPILNFVQNQHINYRDTTEQLRKQIEEIQSAEEEKNAKDGEDGDEDFDKNIKKNSAITHADGIIVYCNSTKNHVAAVGEFFPTTGTIIVKAGSHISLSDSKSLKTPIKRKRKEIFTKSVKDADYYILSEDYLFNSPSTASSCCLGRESNGWTDWKVRTEDNKLTDLKTYMTI